MTYNASAVLANLTNLSDSGFTGLYQRANLAADGVLGMSIWLMLVGVAFLTLLRLGVNTRDVFVACSFFSFAVALFLKGMSIIPDVFFLACFVWMCAMGVLVVVRQ